MKRYLFAALILTSLLNGLNGQVIMPPAYSSGIKVNFVRTWQPVKPYANDSDVINSSRTIQEVRQTTQYFDGLSRPLQTVAKKGSLITGGSQLDMVMPVVYDQFGRNEYQFLPFAANNTGGNTSLSDGFFKLNAFQQDSTFNKGMFSDETYYYAKTKFEASPLNRPMETYAPGNNWVGTATQSSEANRRGIKMKFWVNTVTDSVRIWSVTDVSNDFGTYATGSNYAAGQLYKNVSQDEHNKQVVEFKDKEGKVLLKKVQLSADADTGTGKGYYGWLCTYYIYDDLGNLRCVVQPKGVELLAANSWSMSYSSGVIMNEQCFRYEYDRRNRMIMKKVPGAGIVYMIYDARDRLVMTQDSLMRAAHKWQYSLYDVLNRPTITGLITDNTYYNDAPYHRSHADTSIAWPNPASYTDELLTRTFYDDYSWRSGEGNPLSATRSTSYDSHLISPDDGTFPYPQSAVVQSNQLNGMPTGTKTKILGTSSDFLYTVSFYDHSGRVVQTQANNITTGTEISVVQYSWTGQPLLTVNKHEKAGTNSQTTVTVTKLTYDELFRLSKTEKKIGTTEVNSGSMPGSWTTENENEYDALGQLKKKKLGATPLDSLNYDYNIRGWMLGMNRSYVKDTTSTANWFGYDLGYDKTSLTVNGSSHSYTAAQYSGNISGTLWRSTGDDMLRKYDFMYDAANRFLSADFNQLNSNSFSKAAGLNFSVSGMSYDANGNILNMNQKGWKLGGSITIDSLLYGYNSNSNKLDYVNDRANDTASKLGDFKEYTNNTSQDYSYDANGNLAVDNNKKLNLIHYNHLNLPDSIRITGKGIIKYTYDAAGNKLKKITLDSTGASVKTTTTLYLVGNYVNDTLQFIGTEEGRARINTDSSAVVYDYMIRDHLGNVRMILTEETKTDSYPAATMETANATVEEGFYGNLLETRDDPPSGYPANTPSGNAKVANVRGNINFGPVHLEIGPGMLLKVMAGDKFNLTVNSWWRSKSSPSNSSNPLGLNQLLNAISGSAAASSSGHINSSELQSSGELYNSVNNFLGSQSYNSSKPKAFVNWILFDERFNYVSTNSGYEQIGADDTYTTHTRADMPVDKSGYLYIYVSNETPNINVYFDNLQVTHIRGPLVSEESFYQFGLSQAGLSSNALGFGGSEAKKKFQGQELAHKEFSDGSGLEMYEFKWRMDDPQIGRFWQIDPLAEKYAYNSMYAFSENKVVRHVELEGLESWDFMSTLKNAAGFGNTTTKSFAKGMVEVAKDPKTYESAILGLGSIVGAGLLIGFTDGALSGVIATTEISIEAPVLRNTLKVSPVTEIPVMGTTPVAAESSSTSTMVQASTKSTGSSPSFIVDTKGTAFPVPKGATGPTPVINNAGNQTGIAFTGGTGGANGQVTTMRIMDPTPPRGKSPGFPNGYIKYENAGQVGGKPQGVNPYTGKTLPNSQSHYPINGVPIFRW